MRAGDWVFSSRSSYYECVTLHMFLLTFSNQTKFKIRDKNRSPLEFKALGVEFLIVEMTYLP